jgi:hypothetical protein
MIRKPRLARVYRSAFECSKVLVCTYPLELLKYRDDTAYAINPCVYAGFTHFSRLNPSLSATLSSSKSFIQIIA